MKKLSFWCLVILSSVPSIMTWLLPEGIYVSAFTPRAAKQMILGETNQLDLHCCMWGTKVNCQEDTKWTCAATPIYCNPDDYVEGICNTSVCQSDNRSGARCIVESFTPILINCRATGASKTDGCQSGQARCEFTELQVISPPTIGKCATGTTLCELRPMNKCM